MVAARASDPHRPRRTPTLGLRWLLLAGLAILLMVVDQREQHLDAVRKAISATVYPLRVIVDAPVSAWRWLQQTTANRNELLLENSRLNAERLLTYARLQRYAALEAENARLRAMLEATARVTDRVRVAEIMSVSSNPYRHSIVIDKGTQDDVYDGQALVDADGVVGQVIEAGILSSQALLISDPDHALPVEVNRNGLRTIAFGTGEYDRLDLQYLPNNAAIETGDLLVTSGLGGTFPAGYPVAVVDSVERLPQEPFARVSARPSAALNQVREIMLIWPSGQEAPGTEESAAPGGGAEDPATPDGAAEPTATDAAADGEQDDG